jgi:hypothetical protein
MKFYLAGFIVAFIPFALGMLLVLKRHKPDEREMALSYQISSYEGISAGIIAGVLYFALPQLNWFFALMAGVSVVRGIIGLLVFTLR